MAAPAGEPGKDSIGRFGRFGRDLGAAVAAGLSLILLFAGSLYFNKAVFVALVVLMASIAVTELTGALRPAGVRLPLLVLIAAAIAMPVGAYLAGPGALAIAAGCTILLVAFSRLAGGREGFVRDVTSGVFVAMYVPFLAGFATLLLRPEDGPGKTWEGFAGSVLVCLLGGVAGTVLLLDSSVWVGLLLGVAAAVVGTLGDLTMSMFKRDLGIKDMGRLIPGHGGLMDRLDSLLPTALVSWLILMPLVG